MSKDAMRGTLISYKATPEPPLVRDVRGVGIDGMPDAS